MSSTHDPKYIELVSRLRSARKARRMSQRELAEALKKPQSYVSKVETCERRLDVIETVGWCIALGIDLDEALPPSVRKVLRGTKREG